MGAKQYFQINETSLTIIETIFFVNDFKHKESYLKVGFAMIEDINKNDAANSNLIAGVENAILFIDYITEEECQLFRQIYH